MKIAEFLELVPKLHETERFQRLDRRAKYYDGEQYKDRPLDVCGYRKGMSGVAGSLTCSPAWTQRDPGAVWNLTAEAVDELTNWSVAGDAWCTIRVPDDPQAEDFLTAVAEQAAMVDAVAECRSLGGAQGAVAIAMAIRNGEYFLEPLSARDTWPLEWADEPSHVLSVVAHVYQQEDQFRRPGDPPVWVARIWTKVDETTMRRIRRQRLGGLLDDEWTWETVSVVKHGLGWCPVVWCPQGASLGSHEGTPDVKCGEALVDEANELYAAAGATTKRNADDTLVIREDPALNPGQVKKGSFATIFARGGAEYLTQSGESAQICLEVAERRGQQYLRRARVIIPKAEDMAAATSGESLRRQFQPMTRQTDKLRRRYGRWLIIPLCRMMLRAARTGAGRGQALAIPPRVEEVDGKMQVTQRSPGKSDFVSLKWPDPFQATPADVAASTSSLSTATGGKQILSVRTAVATLGTMGVQIGSVDQELERIGEDQEAATKRELEVMNAGAPPPGESGPVDEESEDEPRAAE